MTDDAYIDAPRDVREGEDLDVERLTEFLVAEIDGLEPPLTVRQFPSGYSNLTYFLASADGRQFVLRRPPFGAQVESGHDMQREYRILSHLHPVFDRAPTPFLYTEDDDVIGAPFYVMERVRGVILRGADPGFEIDEDTMGGICRSLVDTLVDIHAVDLAEAGLDDFGRPEGYVERQVTGWSRRWKKAKTDEVATIDRAAAWLADNMPAESGAALIHNDFKYDNVVLDPDDLTNVRAVLDWEMATVGDPLMDLGTSLAYWVEADDDPILQTVAGPTGLPGNLTRAEVVEYYAEQSGRDLADVLFYYVYGCFKVAVIGQQIYYRFVQGHTRDPRFAGLIHLIRAIGKEVDRALEQGTISSR